MSLPVLYIVIPILVSVILLALPKRARLAVIVSLTLYLTLSLVSLFHNFGEVMKLGPVSFELDTSLDLLGRSLVLDNQDRLYLLMVSLFSMFWIGGIQAAGIRSRVIPYQLIVTASLIAALAVEPFIYSAIFIEIAVISSLPMVIIRGEQIGKGILRFLIFQTLAMPLVLLGGWLIGGNQASPSNVQQITTAGFFLGTGFAFWLAVFPFHSWVPQLCEGTHPYLATFILTMFPQVALIALLRFASEVAWIRGSQTFSTILVSIGIIMIIAAAIWAFYERKVLRLLGLVVLFESGCLLLFVGMQSHVAIESLYLSLFPRALALALAGLSISILLTSKSIDPDSTITGSFKDHPFAAGGLVVSFLSIIGFPLLAEFPNKLILLDLLRNSNPGVIVWVIISFIGMVIPVISLLQRMTKFETTGMKITENWLQISLIIIGALFLVILGLFPNLYRMILLPLLQYLPKII
jgi:formate hydrogenlyase subunit 3/multisubunit Na+/H+ antiporter MnhD subunit